MERTDIQTVQLFCIIRVLREEKKKNKPTDLYTCFRHLPKWKAVVNQVTAMCMLISILSCYRGVQEESRKTFKVLFSIPSQHVIIAKSSLPFFFFPLNRLRIMQMVFLIVHEMSLHFPFTLRVLSFNPLFGPFQTNVRGCIVSSFFFFPPLFFSFNRKWNFEAKWLEIFFFF